MEYQLVEVRKHRKVAHKVGQLLVDMDTELLGQQSFQSGRGQAHLHIGQLDRVWGLLVDNQPRTVDQFDGAHSDPLEQEPQSTRPFVPELAEVSEPSMLLPMETTSSQRTRIF
jgi:hypothetical protein